MLSAVRLAFPPTLSLAQAIAAEAEFARLLLSLDAAPLTPPARDLNFMTATIATLVAAHAAGKPLTATIEETYDRIASP